MPERGNQRSPNEAVLLERNGRFFFYQPDTGVISSDENIEAAYAKFANARRTFFEEVEQAGIARTTAPAPTEPAAGAPRGTAGEFKLFLAKTCVVLLVIAVVGGLAASMVARAVSGVAAAVDQSLAPLKAITMADVAGKATAIAKDAQSLTQQQRESLRQSILTISRELMPMVDAWRNSAPTPEPNSNPEATPVPNRPGR